MRIFGASSQTGVKYICWVLESESMANSHGGPKHGSLAHSSTMCEVSLASDASPIWAHTRAHYTCVSMCAMCLMVHCASRVARLGRCAAVRRVIQALNGLRSGEDTMGS